MIADMTVQALSADASGQDQIPVEELPAVSARTLVIFYSGDGGWRDIDKKISEYLNLNGVAVLGVDSLRYFWQQKSPGKVGSDLEKLIATYRTKWGVKRVALVGFSIGAGVLPFAWNTISHSTQNNVDLIAMLSLDPKASFQISVSGYLGWQSASDMAVGPAAASLPHEKVLCFYGADEKQAGESGCLLKVMRGATLIERPGGHHFDGNYIPIAQAILRRLSK
ncbi:hypothetical protein GCM10007874_72880 [Labrys miyagiensis]|uniref:Bacterial virulence domain-containing protein n=2 Tax=Labrys miyagiensis TaxID=346912 RepID=A0ABQ6D160_9HYPH|nr:hypothetical protein GCM10007874_72880 [Labrys miyagiensis]